MDRARLIEEILREKAGLPSKSSEEPEEVSTYVKETPDLVQTMSLTIEDLIEAADAIHQQGFRPGTIIMSPEVFRELISIRDIGGNIVEYLPGRITYSNNTNQISSAQLDWDDQSY